MATYSALQASLLLQLSAPCLSSSTSSSPSLSCRSSFRGAPLHSCEASGNLSLQAADIMRSRNGTFVCAAATSELVAEKPPQVKEQPDPCRFQRLGWICITSLSLHGVLSKCTSVKQILLAFSIITTMHIADSRRWRKRQPHLHPSVAVPFKHILSSILFLTRFFVLMESIFHGQLITKEEGLVLYEDMVLGRSFEDMCAQMYYRGKMFGFVHLYNGQEAVSTGFIKCLKQGDFVCSTYRDHVHALSKGVPARAVMSELFGKATGVCRGQGGSMHMFSKEHGLLGGFAFIGEGIPVATGAAFKTKYEKEVLKNDKADAVTVAFFGDGTCNNGQFFECLNMAALWKLPIIFVVENNLWAIGMSHVRATSDPEIWKKGSAFGMPGVHVDGMDVLKVREVALEAVARARRGDGPTLVECETYRFRGHSLADPDELRKPAEKAQYAARDPIVALKKYLLEHNLAEEAELQSIQKRIDEVVEDAVDFADASPLPPRSQLLENVFADPKGFGIGPDGKYRCEDPSFTAGTAQV